MAGTKLVQLLSLSGLVRGGKSGDLAFHERKIDSANASGFTRAIDIRHRSLLCIVDPNCAIA